MNEILPMRRYRTRAGHVVAGMVRHERSYGPHGPIDTHPWLVTLCDPKGILTQQWYTRDGYWAAAGKSELDLLEVQV